MGSLHFTLLKLTQKYTMKIKVKIPVLEIFEYVTSTHPALVTRNQHFVEKEWRCAQMNREAYNKMFLSWLIEKKNDGYTTFVLPYPISPCQKEYLDEVGVFIHKIGLRFGFVTIQAMCPTEQKYNSTCLRNNPFDRLHFVDGRIIES